MISPAKKCHTMLNIIKKVYNGTPLYLRFVTVDVPHKLAVMKMLLFFSFSLHLPTLDDD